jgi:hypothetical protein
MLHRHAEHRDCNQCHATHGTARVTKTKCLSCHETMTNHNPAAQFCQACHPFAE